MKFDFDKYALDTNLRELRRDGELVAMQPQVFDLLVHLLKRRDHVVSRNELIALVWGGRTVSDSTLDSRINAARNAIGDCGKEQRLIRTIPRKGLRFVGTVNEQVNGVHPPPEPAEAAAEPRPLPLPDRPAIAVLPFDNMSGDQEQEYFSDGISEDIITALSKLRWFFVIARNSSFSYKGKAVHLKQVAAELGVRYVLEGSVRKSGDRVRITAQLNDTATGSHVWAEHYDRDLVDVFAVQDEITDAIVAAIEPQIYAAENFRSRRKPPNSVDAWDLVMRALSHHWRVTRTDSAAAQTLLEQAIAIDPNYGQALALIATNHMFGVHLGWADITTVAPIAERAALAAIAADSEDAWAHTALASVYFSTRRLDHALAEFELALQLNPNFSLAQGYYALALSYSGRWQDSYAAAQRAIRQSPRDPSSAIYYGVAAYAQFVGRNYCEAISLAREATRQRGDLSGAYRVLTVAAGMAGKIDVAKAALEELRRTQPNISLAWIATQLPWKLDADREHYLEGFRRAGLE
ncbi:MULTISPECIES: winged helix-turn-helix domain-containing protein [unclassified Bradyrhizobium]|uniref:winged helix-turn-helix domain-containing protein n=1 Tax=unclassified Bradyrhizobium TaxID=2631580 RepID=UPI001BA939B6|nr:MULTISPECIES: winged helix-turn-helix domain-containing protein [unclassified Bradyrhizobium]MBR1230330.1 winged helix-turn-helix domain-containing protein [Bradyrhizobium sp. AUGA SZCCT0176]MBR1302407.1 winged helix-turn-helix domain-containing protein [Bradyrhizobium sp. AUGA SZCCT0042]